MSGKIKALQGGLQGLGADRSSYLLPQVVGETSGMRGREPPVIHRVETLDYFVARGIRFCFQNQSVVFAIPWNVRSGVWLHENMSTIDATAKRDHADEETRL